MTGAAGFIGARFVESCLLRGIPFLAVDRPDHFILRKEHRQIAFGEVIDRERLLDWLEAERPALRGIVHLGACTDTTQMDVAYLERMNLGYTQVRAPIGGAIDISPMVVLFLLDMLYRLLISLLGRL